MNDVLELYSPHAKQLEVHNSKKRFVVAAFGRQSGKSTCALNQMLKSAWEHNDTRYWYVSPTFPQARVMYRRLVGMLWPCREVMLKKNQTELRVKLMNGSEIRFVSGLVFDDLRGETLHGAIIDEVRDQHPDLWPMIIRPMLATTKGWAWFVSTPSGFDHFYDLAQNAKTDDAWDFFSAPSIANPLFSQEEFEAAKRNMTEAQFAQEILAEFRALNAGRVYYAFGEHNKAESCPFMADKLWSPYHTVILGPDFNVNPICFSMSQHAYEKWWFFDHVRLTDSNTEEASKEFRDKILIMKQQGFRPPLDVIICGDASGNARSTKSNDSDYDIIKQILKAADISYRDQTPDANPSIKDRVNAVNAKCKSASGEISLFTHPIYAKWLIHDFERTLWKQSSDFTIDPGKDKQLGHMSDGAGYPIVAMSPVKAVKQAGKLSIIQRTI